MTTVYLALGANVGDRRGNIEQAIKLLGDILSDMRSAPIYQSKAVGYTNQPDFLNTAVSGQTDLEPLALLAAIKQVEQQIGRTKTFRWGPREIDIDIIFYGDETLKSDELTLPHPVFRERDFVLKPLADLNPNLIDPISRQTVEQLLSRLCLSERSIG